MSRPSLASVLAEKPQSVTLKPAQPYDARSDTDASDDPWREKVKRQWSQFQAFGWDMMMMDKIRRQNRIVRETVTKIQNGTVGKSDSGSESPAKEDDMGFSIGDHVTHVYQPDPPLPSPKSEIPGWVKVAAIIGSGLVGAAAWNLFGPKTQPATVPAKSESSLNPGGVTIEVVKDPVPK